jgi:hypothetical protein
MQKKTVLLSHMRTMVLDIYQHLPEQNQPVLLVNIAAP